MTGPPAKDAYASILDAIDRGLYRPGDRLVEAELAERLGMSRTPVREALQRLAAQGMASRDGRSMVVASLDHDQTVELYAVRTELEALAARLAARHAAPEEVSVLAEMVEEDRAALDDTAALARANHRFHDQVHRASHNRFLVAQLGLVRRSMALMATTSLAVRGRGPAALAEHGAIVAAIGVRDEPAADAAMRTHLGRAFEVRLRQAASEA